MSSTLVESITDVFRSQMLGSFAASSGEQESSVLRGFETSIGTMVAGLGAKVRQSGFTRQIMDLVNSPANDTQVLENPRSLVEGQPASEGLGARFTSMLFGNRLPAITETIGNVSGIRSGTAASLMSVGAPLVLASLVKRVRESGMDFSRLTHFLSIEANDAGSSLPRGVSGLLGSEAEPVYPAPVIHKKSRGWIWPLVVAVAVIVLLILWFSLRGPGPGPVGSVTTATGEFVERTLPGNVSLRIPAGRMEDNLLQFIQDPSRPVDQTTWFDFDRLLFHTNSATLLPGSEEQLRNIAAILQAYPNVHVKIGGYTDNTGDPAANQVLSQRRADTVKQQLVDMGISADRLEAEGYGDQHPVADNGTEAGRQQNRRISLRVTQK